MKIEHVHFFYNWMRWKLPIFLKYSIQFLRFHLIESI